MPLLYHPLPGALGICDFATGFRPPELVKVRPVIVVSPRHRTSQLVTVVPLSSTPPATQEPWHWPVPPGAYPIARGAMWAKCDLVQTVGPNRLDRVRGGKVNGKRQYLSLQIKPEELAAVRQAIRAALAL